MTITIQDAGEQIREAARKSQHQHVTIRLAIGEMMCQGDIGILRVAAPPKGARKVDPPAGRQVAPGTTKGSRHCAHGDLEFRRFSGDSLSDLCVTALSAKWQLEHPEHGHVKVLCAPGDHFQFIHQQNEKRQRVLD